jgi:hypothetical protein
MQLTKEENQKKNSVISGYFNFNVQLFLEMYCGVAFSIPSDSLLLLVKYSVFFFVRIMLHINF